MFGKLCSMVFFTAACLALFIALPVSAQEDSQKQISDAELEKAAKAYAEVTTLNQEFQEDLQNVQDSSKRQEMQDAVNKKMMQAVEDAGLTVDRYVHIMRALREDDELNVKFTEKMQQVR